MRRKSPSAAQGPRPRAFSPGSTRAGGTRAAVVITAPPSPTSFLPLPQKEQALWHHLTAGIPSDPPQLRSPWCPLVPVANLHAELAERGLSCVGRHPRCRPGAAAQYLFTAPESTQSAVQAEAAQCRTSRSGPLQDASPIFPPQSFPHGPWPTYRATQLNQVFLITASQYGSS